MRLGGIYREIECLRVSYIVMQLREHVDEHNGRPCLTIALDYRSDMRKMHNNCVSYSIK